MYAGKACYNEICRHKSKFTFFLNEFSIAFPLKFGNTDFDFKPLISISIYQEYKAISLHPFTLTFDIPSRGYILALQCIRGNLIQKQSGVKNNTSLKYFSISNGIIRRTSKSPILPLIAVYFWKSQYLTSKFNTWLCQLVQCQWLNLQTSCAGPAAQ